MKLYHRLSDKQRTLIKCFIVVVALGQVIYQGLKCHRNDKGSIEIITQAVVEDIDNKTLHLRYPFNDFNNAAFDKYLLSEFNFLQLTPDDTLYVVLQKEEKYYEPHYITTEKPRYLQENEVLLEAKAIGERQWSWLMTFPNIQEYKASKKEIKELNNKKVVDVILKIYKNSNSTISKIIFE